MKILVTLTADNAPATSRPQLTIIATGDACDPLLDSMLESQLPVKEALTRLIDMAQLVAVSNIAQPGGSR